MNRVFRQPVFLFFLAIVIVGFSGCAKEEIVEENQKVEVAENIEENIDSLEDIDDELVTITTEEINEEFELKAKMDTSDWLIYRNEEYGFEVKYPKDWEAGEWYGDPKTDKKGIVVGLGLYAQGSKPGGGTWGIDIKNNSLKDLEKNISNLGSQFSDRREVRKKVNFQGHDAILVEVSTDECCDDFHWQSTDLFVMKDDYLFIISVDDEYANFTFIK